MGSTKIIGKLGKYAGVAGTALTPISEVDISSKMFSQEDFNLIAQYNPEKLNSFTVKAGVVTGLDACSWGIVRSVAKTPSMLTRLLPGKDPSWTDSYDATINKAVNARNIYEQGRRIFAGD